MTDIITAFNLPIPTYASSLYGVHVDVPSVGPLYFGSFRGLLLTPVYDKAAAFLGQSNIANTKANICSDSSNNVYVVGGYRGAATSVVQNMNGTSSSYSLPLNNSTFADPFFVSYNSNGVVTNGVCLFSTASKTANSYASAVVKDFAGNIYMGGVYNATPSNIRNFDGSLSSFVLPTGINDVFIIKYDSNGTVQRAITLCGSNQTGTDSITHMVVDSSNNLYITGSISTSVASPINNLNGTASAFNIQALASTKGYVVRYDSNGVCTGGGNMFRQSGTFDQGNYIYVDNTRNIYVLGTISNGSTITTLFNFNGADSGVSVLPAAGTGTTSDVFIAKWNASGTAQFATYLVNGSTADSGLGMCVDSSNNMYITGFYSSAATSRTFRNFNGTNSAFSFGFGANNDAFLLKYSSNGTLTQAAIIVRGSGTNDSGNWVVCDSNNNVYVVGEYNTNAGTIPVRNLSTGGDSGLFLPNDTNGTYPFVLKYDSAGVISSAIRPYKGTGNCTVDKCVIVNDGLFLVGSYITNSNVPLVNMAGSNTPRTLPTTVSGTSSNYALVRLQL